MVEFLDDTNQLESNTIGVFRSAATMAGGRRFSFGSLVAVGDKNGRIGLGYGKANEVPPAIEKAQKDAKKNLKKVVLQGGTIPHEVLGRYGASEVKLIPASPGTGVVAGATVRAVLELAGISPRRSSMGFRSSARKTPLPPSAVSKSIPPRSMNASSEVPPSSRPLPAMPRR